VSRYSTPRRTATSRETVDLPEPDGPSIATTSGLRDACGCEPGTGDLLRRERGRPQRSRGRAAARSGRAVNIKKGQFLAPEDARNIVEKAQGAGCERLMLTERGVSFGYNNLVVDMRSFPIMSEFGVPIVFDVTHSLQLPGGLGNATGGLSQYIEPLARAGVACGVDAVFMEVHDAPERAPSDGPNMLPLARMGSLLESLRDIQTLVRNMKQSKSKEANS